jgi:NAD(P)-dependent dehydrogenase (short-subunit alcohol dehydrogenase family)
MSAIAARHAHLDVLVNNAGTVVASWAKATAAADVESIMVGWRNLQPVIKLLLMLALNVNSPPYILRVCTGTVHWYYERTGKGRAAPIMCYNYKPGCRRQPEPKAIHIGLRA